MARAHSKKNDAHSTSPFDAAALRARCVEPEGDPTEVIPAALLQRLLAETMPDGSTGGAAPRFEIVERDPDDDVIIDDSAFEEAFAEMVGEAAAE
jgi:hypothetical protein